LGFDTCLISNNRKPRVKSFSEKVKSRYLYDAHKPSKKGYRKAMKQMGTDTAHTLLIGDQLFTDVYGARRVGIHSILVKPIHPKEPLQVVLKRCLERIVLYFYKRSKKGRK